MDDFVYARYVPGSLATLGNGNAVTKSVLQCVVGDRSPILLCNLIPNVVEACHLGPEFEGDSEIIFSVLGQRSVQLFGYFLRPRFLMGGDGSSYLYGEDIGEDKCKSNFIDDGNSEMVSPSPKYKISGDSPVYIILDSDEEDGNAKPAERNAETGAVAVDEKKKRKIDAINEDLESARVSGDPEQDREYDIEVGKVKMETKEKDLLVGGYVDVAEKDNDYEIILEEGAIVKEVDAYDATPNGKYNFNEIVIDQGKVTSMEVPLSKITNDLTLGQGKAVYFNIKVYVTYISPDQTIWFWACKTCHKKVIKIVDSVYWCEKCNAIVQCCLRYVIEVKISDFSGDAWVTVFNEVAENLIGCTAEELARIKANEGYDKYQLQLKKATGTQHLFRVSVQHVEFMNKKRQKITVLTQAPADR
ncbi:hypothetical protein COCNU_08G000210 [Cocos nucifera]|uniref:Replication factor A C-terminal domain-containing protein n=1 Tax=Cocos nucifera TaxID=13894 RepID=A0A8K0N5P3_COCNU|nr:hypothetical protein COCNU_08G000210 [Cocos nucifera]